MTINFWSNSKQFDAKLRQFGLRIHITDVRRLLKFLAAFMRHVLESQSGQQPA